MVKRVLTLITGDAIAACLALLISHYLNYGDLPTGEELVETHLVRGALFIFTTLISSFLLEIYYLNRFLGGKECAVRIGTAVIFSFFVLSGIFHFQPLYMYGGWMLVVALIIFGCLQLGWHYLCYLSSRFSAFARRVLVLGTGPLARQIGSLITAGSQNYVLSGYVGCASENVELTPADIPVLAEPLYERVKSSKAHKIVISLSERRGIFPLQEVLTCKFSGIEVVDAPSFYEQMTGKLLLENITPSWFIFSQGFKVTFILRIMKRVIDIACAMLILLVVLPLLPFIVLMIKLDSPGPVLFRQQRVGAREKNFTIYKFRTMRADAEKGTGAVWASMDDPRITRVGEFLRKTRIDEIPQLFNVLGGSMSLVGPRPERPEFVEKLKEIIPYYSSRHFVKPGVTGWAQVSYPYGASVEDAIEKLRYDLYYIKNLTLVFDLMIILETIKVVLFRRGGR
ncbi:TIGR03013 family XrtA/PEP-CTERM system glycosyltransferase [Geotalea sp. SG265]|uniref:TIGR03013 family XrtA/PEP-CTERM system glycosyltransferase n=1 Tax=Geotalea sp. SG265 TaxID=2922867 RepID=UPI001FAFBB78|nr:TIGR03013 family XrtA/PEP-CTERM system glycosyltransferase [Geotalea sp. SG265]